jgi:multicomponent Na+:H+ antiporter subunit B
MGNFHLKTLKETDYNSQRTGDYYLESARKETGAPNIVSSIYLIYRVYDTILELLVFSTAVLGVSLYARFELREGESKFGLDRERVESKVVQASAFLLFPPVVLFGLYIALSGHLSPGGGFAGGVIGGTGILLISLSIGAREVAKRFREEEMKHIEFLIILVILVFVFFFMAKVGQLLFGGKETIFMASLNLVIGLKVFIGTWAILHFFIEHRGEA